MDTEILIVDDSTVVRTSLRNWLKTFFPYCSIEEARSGEEAVRRIVTQSTDIVLMDIGLPGINGVEATRRIKAVAPETKVVMFTVYNESKYRKEALAAGASAYVAKQKIHNELLPVLMDLMGNPSSGPRKAPRFEIFRNGGNPVK